MNVLALDCVSTRWTLAVKTPDKYACLTFDLGMKQGEKMLPSLIYLLGEVDLPPAALDYAAITAGPGSFTSLRIGFAMLKAISISHNVPIYAVPTLELYAHPFLHLYENVISVIDSKRGASKQDSQHAHFFASIYRGGACVSCGDYTIEEIEEIVRLSAGMREAKERILVCGADAPSFCAIVKAHNVLPDSENDDGSGGYKCAPALNTVDALFELAEKMRLAPSPPLAADAGPLYMRLSEAEVAAKRKDSCR
ncbi:MAG: tRNA (adenosine(37)-N6)-threonylcarbamoyltransferase complex dimerization subunit type 1 TsaB [Treponemataceae bacterium]|nr:MAG: tRNA (adenosine(37)-N6)-threonylcarbamoyltransferase complex dimerization subunit type 1 TsaB [Treponemataceae bacterium]